VRDFRCGVFATRRAPESDGRGWIDGLELVGASFGFARLAIVDLSPEAMQPMRSENGRYVLCFNGEIYNHLTLKAELQSLGRQFRTRSDSEVILVGFEVWGDAVIEKLDGMFALGLWDAQEQRLVLARDRVGKKPLYYIHDARVGFRFASTAEALFESGVPKALDIQALPSLLTFGTARPPHSMYEGVSQLPPASMLAVQSRGASTSAIPVPVVRRYWRAPFDATPLKISVEEALVEVRRLIHQAVKKRLQADVPIAAFLSGGLDSTIVVSHLAELVGTDIQTVTLGFSRDPRYDERAYGRQAANHFGLQNQALDLEPSRFEVVDELVRAHGSPFADSSALPMSFVSRRAREFAPVVMTGDGGDELFAGYMRLLIVEATESVSSKASRATKDFALRSADRSLRARFERIARRAVLPLADRMLSWQTVFGFELSRVLRKDVYHSVRVTQPREESFSILSGFGEGTTFAKILRYNFETYLPDDLLVKADRSSMMHSVELRSPFLDTELIEFAARLPDSMRRKGRTTKWLLRKAYETRLPKSILERPKMGFGLPLDAWFRNELRGFLHERISSSRTLYAYIDRSFVVRLLHQHFSGELDGNHRLWLLLTLAIWLDGLQEPSRTNYPELRIIRD
jgi:asparagine synthase (glutamine-hydrolysing)